MMGSFQLIEMKWVPDAERIWVRRSVLGGGGCVECLEGRESEGEIGI